MKQIILAMSMAIAFTTAAQRGKTPLMAPVLAKGYYVNQRNDTVRGKVQVNPPDKTDFYSRFSFKKQRASRPKPMDTRVAKAYGFKDRDFEMLDHDGGRIFAERLVAGRLDFYEYRYNSTAKGEPVIASYYFIRDNGADENEAELRQLREISGKFYKKRLKPYMKAQPWIWETLDKYAFDKEKVIEAISEFNKFYSASAFN